MTRSAWSDRRLLLLLVGVGFVVQVPGLLWGVPVGKAINNGVRILDGDVPYRDFWTMYAPGHFYIVAALFKVFGTHVWVQGAASRLFVAVDAGLFFALLRRLGLPSRSAWTIGVLFVGMLWTVHPEMSSYETALIWLLPAMIRIITYVRGRGARSLVVAGAFCGVGAWFKHDVSFYVVFGIVVGLSVSWWLLPGRRPAGWVPPAGVLARIAAGAFATALPVLLLVIWTAGPAAWRDLIVFPATDFKVVRGEGYPALIPEWRLLEPWIRSPGNPRHAAAVVDYLASWVLATVPQFVFPVAVAALILRRRLLEPDTLALAAVSLAPMPLFWAAAHVQQNTHLDSLSVLSCLLGTLTWTSRGVDRRWRVASMWLGVPLAAALLTKPALQVAEAAYFWPSHARLDFPNASGIRLPRWQYDVYQPIVSWIREHVPPDEPIYSGLLRHDAIVISNQSFYFLAGRPIASRYNEIHPGLVDRPEVQREIIDELERRRVRCAILWEFGWDREVMDRILEERRKAIPALGARLLDDYFAREFEPVARFGEYVLMWRKGVPMPLPRLTGSPRSGERLLQR